MDILQILALIGVVLSVLILVGCDMYKHTLKANMLVDYYTDKTCPNCGARHSRIDNYYCDKCSSRFRKWDMPDKINEDGLSKSYE